LVGLKFDRLTFEQAVADVAARSPVAPLTYVVTPNVDHIVRLEEGADGPDVRRAYLEADLCFCDSRILALLARFSGAPVDIVPGSDLTAALLLNCLNAGDRLNLIGGDTNTAARFAAMFPEVHIAHYEPPMGLMQNPAAIQDTVTFIEGHPARFSLIAVGSPQQELIAWHAKQHGKSTGVALCVGASVEFLTGVKRRAPRWMQTAHLEWLHRLFSEPRRLWKRYLLRDTRIFGIVLGWYLRRPRGDA
jgi:N-acetylglucosaminyldiphosphoundecaprenol N-acetyl-beta-D-mannosaminyltransferase